MATTAKGELVATQAADTTTHPNAMDSLQPRGLRVSPSVRVVETQDGAVLLDLTQGICFGMNPVGITIWRGLTKEWASEQIVEGLAKDDPKIELGLIRRDVKLFVDSLRAKHLVNDGEPLSRGYPASRALSFLQRLATNEKLPGDRTKKRRFLFWKALWGLALFDVFGFGNSFLASYEFVRGWPVAEMAPGEQALEQACSAINYACVVYPRRVLCLQRSVILICLLRHCGVPAQMVIGAQKFPFSAHAWTEVGGMPVNERKDIQPYMIWERC